MGVRESERRFRTLEGMRPGQLPGQILLGDLLRVAVLVHVQVERSAQREPLLIAQVRRREVILVHRVFELWRRRRGGEEGIEKMFIKGKFYYI